MHTAYDLVNMANHALFYKGTRHWYLLVIALGQRFSISEVEVEQRIRRIARGVF